MDPMGRSKTWVRQPTVKGSRSPQELWSMEAISKGKRKTPSALSDWEQVVVQNAGTSTKKSSLPHKHLKGSAFE